MPKRRAIFRMTYEALAKWLGLPSDCEVIAVKSEQEREIVSFFVRGEGDYCPPTPEGAWAMSRLVDQREMIKPMVEQDLVFQIGPFKIYKVKNV